MANACYKLHCRGNKQKHSDIKYTLIDEYLFIVAVNITKLIIVYALKLSAICDYLKLIFVITMVFGLLNFVTYENSDLTLNG